MFPVVIVIALQFSRKRASQAFDAKLVSAAQIARQGVNAKMLQQLPLQLIAKSLNTVLQIQTYFTNLTNVFVQIQKGICPNSERYLSKLKTHLSKLVSAAQIARQGKNAIMQQYLPCS